MYGIRTRRWKKEKSLIAAVRYFILFLCFIVLPIAGCAKKEIVVPPLTPEPSKVQLTGKFVWYDLFTDDLETISRFYEELFGWTFTNTDPATTRAKNINRNGLPIANAVEIDPVHKERNESGWLGYISVKDVDAAVEIAIQDKGTIYTAPKDLPNRGRIAIVIDGQGAIFGLVNSPLGDPPDQDDIRNGFIGAELWTTDSDQALSFYNAIAGYELDVVDVGEGEKYNLLLRDNIPRAGLVKIPWDDVTPNWIPYVAVPDLKETIEKVEALGGTLLIKPPQELRKNPLAIVADPSGSVFGIQQMSDFETEGGVKQ